MSDTKYCNHCERPIIEIGQCGCDKAEIERLREMLSAARIRFIKGGDFLAKEALVKRIEEMEETDRNLRHELCDLREGHH